MSWLTAEGLTRRYPRAGGGELVALADVSLELARGEAVGLIGPSGSGKTTLGRLLLGLDRPDAGRVCLEGVPLGSLRGSAARGLRRRLQPVAQDPGASLDPRQRVRAALVEPLLAHGLVASREAALERAVELLGAVGLEPGLLERHPHTLSGGQRQRVALARALAVEPELLVADEPLAHLDLLARAELATLLGASCRGRGLSLVLIDHEIAVIASVCSRVLVLDGGRLVEAGSTTALLAHPHHPTTRALVSADLAREPEVPVTTGTSGLSRRVPDG